ncbi:2OG-Fe(II) oxygenase [Chromatiales bacterium (ex Bugula neritina AB1)]|nr:2OG-Fe(II) oxygenase [Chromatiales bacterium (ex Bugula neritina AB1)]
MHDIINLNRYPLDQPESAGWWSLINECRHRLASDGLFNLPGFICDNAIATTVEQLKPLLLTDAYTHSRRHNIYFKPSIEDLPASHAALTEFETSNRTLCADQISQSALIQLYEWAPFARFLAAVMDKPELFTMDDPMARVNVMGYFEDCALNWHFDRSEFTTTLLLQAPLAGGEFEYERALRSDTDPNYEGVADLLEGRRTPARLSLNPGTLNVFRGRNTAHRVTPVEGHKQRIIAVFSYYEQPGVCFSKEERIGFYGRAS